LLGVGLGSSEDRQHGQRRAYGQQVEGFHDSLHLGF
jgi:hypothetical protein